MPDNPIIIYTDGGCSHNPGGTGGYGVVIIDKTGNVVAEHSKGFYATTNNRMEVMAIIRGLEETAFIPGPVKIISDSQYAINCAKGIWGRSKNEDLWEIYDRAAKNRKVEFEWVRGHTGNKYNERCDELATLAMNAPDKTHDEGYEQETDQTQLSLFDTTNRNAVTPYNAMGREIEVNPTLNERPEIVSVQEYIERFHVNKVCAELIIAFYKKDNRSFKTYQKLKTGGNDHWSLKQTDELKQIIGEGKYYEIFRNIKDEKMIISCMKWVCRGLSVSDAIRKVMVDKEISLNATNKN